MVEVMDLWLSVVCSRKSLCFAFSVLLTYETKLRCYLTERLTP